MKRSLFARRCSIEALEDRRVMAGDVLAGIIAGNLVVAGDNSSNWVAVTAGPNPGQVVVTGLNDGSGIATRVNGSSNGAITFNGFSGRIDFIMNGGDDNVSIDGLTSKGTLVDVGRGNDGFSSTNYAVNGDLTVKGGDGDEQVSFTRTEVSGFLAVDLGEGNNQTNFESVHVGRDAKFLGARGADAINSLFLTIDGATSLNLGNGANGFGTTFSDFKRFDYKGGKDVDSLGFSSSDWGPITVDLGDGNNVVQVSGGGTLSGNVSFTAGRGNDTLDINNGTIIGNFTVNLGDGTNSFRTTDDVSGDLVVRGGRGADDMTFTAIFGFMQVGGTLRISFGDGANALGVFKVVAAKATITGGKDGDAFNLNTPMFESLFANLGDGANTLNVNSANIAGRTDIKGGKANDSLVFASSTLSGAVNVDLGQGNNSGQFADSDLLGDVAVLGGRGIDRWIVANSDFSRSLRMDFGDGANELGFGANTVGGTANFRAGSGVDEFRLLDSVFAELSATLGRGNDRAIVGGISSTLGAKFDGGDGKDSYLEEEGKTNTFASLSRKNFETIGTTPTLP